MASLFLRYRGRLTRQNGQLRHKKEPALATSRQGVAGGARAGKGGRHTARRTPARAWPAQLVSGCGVGVAVPAGAGAAGAAVAV